MGMGFPWPSRGISQEDSAQHLLGHLFQSQGTKTALAHQEQHFPFISCSLHAPAQIPVLFCSSLCRAKFLSEDFFKGTLGFRSSAQRPQVVLCPAEIGQEWWQLPAAAQLPFNCWVLLRALLQIKANCWKITAHPSSGCRGISGCSPKIANPPSPSPFPR